MSAFEQYENALASIHPAEYLTSEVDDNNMREGGCKELIQAKWDKLTNIDLGTKMIYKARNNIGDGGCAFINKWNFPLLEAIDLGSYSLDTEENNIGAEGCNLLSVTSWPLLNYFMMSKIV